MFKDSRSTLISLDQIEEDSDRLSPRSKLEQKTLNILTHTTVSQLREADLTAVLIPETTSENSDFEPDKSPLTNDETERFTVTKSPIHRYFRKVERFPPPSIHYSKGGDVLSVHIIGGTNRKQSLDLHKLQSETPAMLAREELMAHTRDFSLGRKDAVSTPRSKLTSKPALTPLSDLRARGRKASPTSAVDNSDHSASPRAQFHVFRDVTLDE